MARDFFTGIATETFFVYPILSFSSLEKFTQESAIPMELWKSAGFPLPSLNHLATAWALKMSTTRVGVVLL